MEELEFNKITKERTIKRNRMSRVGKIIMNKRYETVLRWFEEYGFQIVKKR